MLLLFFQVLTCFFLAGVKRIDDSCMQLSFEDLFSDLTPESHSGCKDETQNSKVSQESVNSTSGVDSGIAMDENVLSLLDQNPKSGKFDFNISYFLIRI